MAVIVPPHEAEILERAIDASDPEWSPAIARGFLSIKLSASDLARMNELAGKGQSGTLGVDEEIELESYRSAARLLEILKLRARVALKRAESAQPPTA